MPKLLIITYYWPPAGGSSVLRWLKFTKYLPEYGWEPVIYTPLNPEFQEEDPSLVGDVPKGISVIKSKITEPYTLYKLFTGKSKKSRLGVGFVSEGKNPALLQKLALWIRSNIFIPDPRILWVKPSVRKLTKYLKINPVDVIVTTGPPHSIHLIGMKYMKKPV